jgi:hypothetical protein
VSLSLPSRRSIAKWGLSFIKTLLSSRIASGYFEMLTYTTTLMD